MHSGLTCVDGCWVPSPLGFTHSLSPSLLWSLPPSLSNLLCTETSMWSRIENVPSFLNVCILSTFPEEGEQCRRGDRNYRRERLRRSPVYCLCVSVHVCVCVHCNAEQGKSLSCPPLAGIMYWLGAALRLRERGVKSGLQRVGWRVGAAGSRGRSAPSATRAAWVNSTGVSTAIAKAITQEHRAVTLFSVCPMTKPPSSCYLLLINIWQVAVIPPSVFLPLASVIRCRGCSASSLNNAVPHAVKRAFCPLSCSLHAVSFLLSSFSPHAAPPWLISSLFFEPAPPHVCMEISSRPMCFISNEDLCLHEWRVHVTVRDSKM